MYKRISKLNVKQEIINVVGSNDLYNSDWLPVSEYYENRVNENFEGYSEETCGIPFKSETKIEVILGDYEVGHHTRVAVNEMAMVDENEPSRLNSSYALLKIKERDNIEKLVVIGDFIN